MQHHLTKGLGLKLALLLMCIFPAWADLPQLGDPSLQGFSQLEEKKLGDAFYQTLRANLDFVDDTQLNHYLNSLGQKLQSHSDSASSNFKFFIVESDVINAFAGPDAYIGINSGLILRAKNESQLASVMAHEIAHVTQRHLARMFDEAGNATAITFGAILAAILVGSQDPEAAQAILATGVASSYQSSINFTRQNEYEADRVGIGILTDAGIDPQGMVGFFEILLEQSQGLDLEYLRTHPLSINRVSEAKHRIDKVKTDLRADSSDFQFARARLQVLTAANPAELIDQKTELTKTVNDYRKALAMMRSDRTDEAIVILSRLKNNDRHPWVSMALAEAYRLAGRSKSAEKTLRTLLKLYPGYLPVTLMYTDVLMNSKSRLQESITLLKHQLQTDDKAIVHKALARAYYLNGQTSAALESTGNQYQLQGYKELALQQFENALNQDGNSETTKQRLNTKIELLKVE